MSEEDRVRKLAELKAYVEKRNRELEQELLKLRSLGELVDSALADKSFRRAEVPRPQITPAVGIARPQVSSSALAQVFPVKTPSGVDLADMTIGPRDVKVTPKSEMRFDYNAPPMRAFLIGRVLDPMKAKDSAQKDAGERMEDEVLSYSIEKDENNLLRQIVITNYGDEKRLQELKGAISWTLRRMYERMTGTR